jgi:hypothetical protein
MFVGFKAFGSLFACENIDQNPAECSEQQDQHECFAVARLSEPEQPIEHFDTFLRDADFNPPKTG